MPNHGCVPLAVWLRSRSSFNCRGQQAGRQAGRRASGEKRVGGFAHGEGMERVLCQHGQWVCRARCR